MICEPLRLLRALCVKNPKPKTQNPKLFMELWTAFIVGLAGSLHCVGMCGPIALALPGQQQHWLRILPGRVLYNLGRVVTYTLLGTVIGLFGRGISLAGYQQTLSIVLGALLVILALFTMQVESRFMALPAVNRVMGRVKSRLARLMRWEHPSSLFQIGILNGFLPCGFVYLALAGALSTGEIGGSMAYMAFFGLGTLPAMLAMSLMGAWLGPRFRRVARPLMVSFTLIFGLLLILRGLDLGIPYLSPDLGPDVTAVESCE